MSAAKFLQPHIVALTFVAATLQRISNFQRQKSCNRRMAAPEIGLEPAHSAAALRRPHSCRSAAVGISWRPYGSG